MDPIEAMKAVHRRRLRETLPSKRAELACRWVDRAVRLRLADVLMEDGFAEQAGAARGIGYVDLLRLADLRALLIALREACARSARADPMIAAITMAVGHVSSSREEHELGAIAEWLLRAAGSAGKRNEELEVQVTDLGGRWDVM